MPMLYSYTDRNVFNVVYLLDKISAMYLCRAEKTKGNEVKGVRKFGGDLFVFLDA